MYFAIRRSKDGQYWWRAVGDNNEIMAASELMATKQSCKHAIGVIKLRRRPRLLPCVTRAATGRRPDRRRRSASPGGRGRQRRNCHRRGRHSPADMGRYSWEYGPSETRDPCDYSAGSPRRRLTTATSSVGSRRHPVRLTKERRCPRAPALHWNMGIESPRKQQTQRSEPHDLHDDVQDQGLPQ